MVADEPPLDRVADGQVAIPERRLLEGMLERVREVADREPHAELLAAAPVPPFRVGVVEVALGVLDETHELLDRAVAGAEADRAGVALLDGDAEVALARHGGRQGGEAHVLEELRVAEARLGDAHAGEVEDLAGPEGELPGDDVQAGLGVALHLHGADAGAFALLEDEAQVDRAGLQVGAADDVDLRPQVAHLAVILAELVGGGLDVGVGEPVAGVEAVAGLGPGPAAEGDLVHDAPQGVGGEHRIGGAHAVALELDGAHRITAALLHADDHIEPPGAVGEVLDDAGLFGGEILDLHVQEALRPVIIPDALAVLAVVVGVEATIAGEPGELPPTPRRGLEVRPGDDLGGVQRLGALEADVVDAQVGAGTDADDHDGAARRAGDLRGHDREGALLAQLGLELELGLAERREVERLTQLDLLELERAQGAFGQFPLPFGHAESHGQEGRTRLDDHLHVDFAGRRVEVREHDGLAEPARRVERADRAGGRVAGEGFAGAQGDVTAHEGLGDRAPLGLDRDRAHVGHLLHRARERGRGRGLGQAERRGQQQAGGDEEAAGGRLRHCGIPWRGPRSV